MIDAYVNAIVRHNGPPKRKPKAEPAGEKQPEVRQVPSIPDGSKQVPGYPHYYATKDGHVWTKYRGYPRQLKESVHKEGYHYVNLTGVGRSHTKAVPIHRVIAAAFHPNPDGLRDVNHKNLDKSDNRPENLEWVSHADNCRHARNAGKGTAKLTDAQRAEIYSGGHSDVAFAKRFGVSVTTVRSCRIGRTYAGAKPVQTRLGLT